MKEQFVTYKTSLKLKELGFDEECLGYYEIESNELVTHSWGRHPNKSSWTINAPFWQQVIDCLREKYKIDIYPEPTYSLTKYSFKVITVQGKSKKQEYWDGMGKTYNTYQEARERAILKAIELCQNKK